MKNLTLDNAVSVLYDHIFYAINAFVPALRTRSSKYPYWFTGELVSLIRAKKAAYRDFKRFNTPHDYVTFSYLRSVCKSLSSVCYDNYIARTESCIPLNIKAFWRYVNTNRSAGGLPNAMYFKGDQLSGNAEIANAFANFFESVYSVPDTDYTVNSSSRTTLDLCGLSIDIGEVLSAIDGLNLNKGPGLVGIPVVFFKECKFILSSPLWIVFSLSLLVGRFPSAMKEGIISPVFKSGDKSDITNYRPNILAQCH